MAVMVMSDGSDDDDEDDNNPDIIINMTIKINYNIGRYF